MSFNDNSYCGDESRTRPTAKYIATALIFFLIGSVVAGVLLAGYNERRVSAIYSEAQASIDDANTKIEEMNAVLASLTAGAGGIQLVGAAAATGGYNSDPVVAIADACSPSVVGVNVYVRRTASSGGSFSFPFGNFVIPGYNDQAPANEDEEPVLAGYGSGVIITEDGYIVTNHHVVESAAKVTVVLSDGQELDASVIGSDEYTDVALLKIDGEVSGLHPVVIGDSDALRVGEMSVAIGNPLSSQLFGTLTMGVISANNREVSLSDGRKVKFIQTDAAINSGNSGGGLFNSRGELIGITSMKLSSNYYSSANIEGLAFAIPVNTVMTIVNELMESGSVSYPTMGISSSNFTDKNSEQYGTDAGVMIMQVTSDSPAQRAGLQVGDIITHYNGTRINEYNDLKNMLYQSRVGDTVTLTVVREKQSMDIEIVFNYDSGL